jgi:hypothetical protein
VDLRFPKLTSIRELEEALKQVVEVARSLPQQI